MKTIFTFFLLLLLKCSFAQQNDTLNWNELIKNGNWQTYTSVKKMDQRLFGEFPRWKKMSRANGKFEATDLGGGPKERLFFAANYQNYWIVSYEHGGIGYHTHCFFVSIKENGSVISTDSYKGFKSLDELKTFTATNAIPVNPGSIYDY